MRKALIAFLALVLVCGCGAALAAQAVSAPREDIAFQEYVFSGDQAAADGLTVQLKAGMQHKANWESTVQFSAQDYRTETSFRFLPAGQAEQPEMSYRGVEINFYHDAATTGSDDVFGFSTAYQSLLDTLSPGESGSRTIRFADYYDEYYTRVEKYVKNCSGVLHERKYTEYSRASGMKRLPTGRMPRRTATGRVNAHRPP